MADDQRNDDRVETEIRIAYRTVGSFLSDYALNLSKGGVFIHTDNPLPPKTMVRLVFSLPGVPVLFDVSGRVRWSQQEFDEGDELPGMGIEFVHLEEKVAKWLEAHVDKLRAEVPEDGRQQKKARPLIEVRTTSGSGPQRTEITQRDGRPLGPKRDRGGEE